MTTSCAWGRHNMPPPLHVDLWPFDLESSVRVTWDVGYLCPNFSLPRHLCSRLRFDVRDRQTSDRQTERQTSDAHHLCSGLRPNVRQTSDRRQTVSSLYAPPIRGGGIIIPLFSAGLGLGTCGLVNTTVLSWQKLSLLILWDAVITFSTYDWWILWFNIGVNFIIALRSISLYLLLKLT